MPYPRNVETALRVEAAVREAGAVPATVAVLKGRLKAGLVGEQIRHSARRFAVAKVSLRDLHRVVAAAATGRRRWPQR